MPARVLSGIQPTAEMHIGNYFGAVRNWVALQDTHECIYTVVDLHAITKPYEPERLRANTERMVVDLLACGIDPQKAILFIQSLVPEHTELCWILSCLTPFGDLRRMTQFKDQADFVDEDSSQFLSAGFFSYPVLQAADILVYRAQYVPVGKDQEQHLELSRELARRFNNQFGADFFPEPAPLFTPTPKIMSLVDPNKKMSKSLGERHYIKVFEEEKTLRAKVKTAVTDSGDRPPEGQMSPGVANLFEILGACGKTAELDALSATYKTGTLQYRELKETVADALVELTSALRTRRDEIAQDRAHVDAEIRRMTDQARSIASDTIREVRSLTGLPAKN